MASSSGAKIILNRFSVSIIAKRGYASSSSSSSAAAVSGESSSSKTLINNNNKKKSPVVSWVPDPKTGYYMPENRIHQQQQLDHKVEIFLVKNNNNKKN